MLKKTRFDIQIVFIQLLFFDILLLAIEARLPFADTSSLHTGLLTLHRIDNLLEKVFVIVWFDTKHGMHLGGLQVGDLPRFFNHPLPFPR